MLSWHHWPVALLAVLVVALEGTEWGWNTKVAGLAEGKGWTTSRKLRTREQVRSLFYHGFDNYMTHAFPLDELAPLSCTGKGPDWEHPENIAANDVAGNYSLTLIDVLDTLVILGDKSGFESAVRNTIEWVSFDVNTKPQVFETTIRVLGGLLSGHIIASRRDHLFYLPWYNGELLAMAHDLGERLLPAFATATGLPYARLNLRHGVQHGESPETCTAGAGSLILEFATLSRLTGDDRFEKVAYKAFFALWNRKSDIGLVGNTVSDIDHLSEEVLMGLKINIWTGSWTNPEVTGIGAGIDSFYEYALKWYILSGEVEFLDVWLESYAAVMRYSRASDGFWYRNVNIHSGEVSYYSVDSLSAFWPGLQVLAGDIQNAIKSHLMYWNLWRVHSGLPEVWDIKFRTATSLAYPLRPEFVESTWYLYRATRDPFYLDVGERILYDITSRSKVDCGLTGIKDLRINTRDDRMESFALSETLKYLYLLFDENNFLHQDDSNYVLTTEGHILSLNKENLRPMSAARRKMRRVENHQCPAYQPVLTRRRRNQEEPGLVQGIRSRVDADYSRELLNLLPSGADKNMWSPYGWCEQSKVDLFSYDFILSADGKAVSEDLNPSASKLQPVADGYIVYNVSGIRTHIVSRLDGKGYDITRLGPHAVRTGQLVYVNDDVLKASAGGATQSPAGLERWNREPDVQLRFFTDAPDPVFQVQPGILESLSEMSVTAYTSYFGADLSVQDSGGRNPLFVHSPGLRVVQDLDNLLGCRPYGRHFDSDVILVDRGDCTFVEKLMFARDAGAAGVVVINNEDEGINPSANEAEIGAAGDLEAVALVLVPGYVGDAIESMMSSAGTHGVGVLVSLDPERRTAHTQPGQEIDSESSEKNEPHSAGSGKMLFLNGHALLNTRLVE